MVKTKLQYNISKLFEKLNLQKLAEDLSPYLNLTGGTTIDSVDDIGPSQAGNAGKYLTTDGTNASWGTPAGSGDMTKAEYDTNNDSIVDEAAIITGQGDLATLDAVTEDEITLADVTTNNVSTTKHGFVPKAPNDITKFLRGDATWAVASTGGTGLLWLPARIWVNRTDIGSPAIAARGTNFRYVAWDFHAANIELVVTDFIIPDNYSSGAVTFKYYWTNGGAGSGDVQWGMAFREVNDTGDLNTTTGETTQTDTFTAPLLNILKVSTSTASYTPSAAGVHVRIEVYRNAAAAADTLGNDAWLIGLMIEYTKI